jgi:hypothetical protein
VLYEASHPLVGGLDGKELAKVKDGCNMNGKYRTLTAILVVATGLLMAGCSADSNPVDLGAGPDTAPPAPPTELAAIQAAPVVKLTWAPNTLDLDLQGYLVYRLAGAEVDCLTAEPITTAYFIDRRPVTGVVKYAVAAVDLAGNESSWVQIPLPLPQAAPIRVDS